MSTTTDLNTLVINYLTEAQYEAAVSGGTIDPDQLYLTPEVNSPVTDVEVNGTSVVSGGVAEITIPIYTAGNGISISNGVISLNVPSGDAISYGLIDGTLPLVGVGKAGSMEI